MSDDDTAPKEIEEGPDDEGFLEKIGGALSELTIPKWIRENVKRVLGRLSSAGAELAAAKIEGKAAEIRAKHDGKAAEIRAEHDARAILMKRTAEEIGEKLNISPTYARIASEQAAARIVGEQLNLDRIVEEALVDHLPNELKNKKKLRANAESVEAEISEEFLGEFAREAGAKTTEQMRAMFARLLAGEIVRPGSYSTKTLKIVGELDPIIAKQFQKFCSACCAFYYPGRELIDVRMITIGEKAGENGLAKYGFPYGEIDELRQIGLVRIDLDGYYKLSVSSQKFRGIISPFYFQGSPSIMFTSTEWETPYFKVSGPGLTKAGLELYPIVDLEETPDYAADLVAFLADKQTQIVPFNHFPFD